MGEDITGWSSRKLTGLGGKDNLCLVKPGARTRGMTPCQKRQVRSQGLCSIRMTKFSSSGNNLLQPRMHMAFCASKAIHSVGILWGMMNTTHLDATTAL